MLLRGTRQTAYGLQNALAQQEDAAVVTVIRSCDRDQDKGVQVDAALSHAVPEPPLWEVPVCPQWATSQRSLHANPMGETVNYVVGVVYDQART